MRFYNFVAPRSKAIFLYIAQYRAFSLPHLHQKNEESLSNLLFKVFVAIVLGYCLRIILTGIHQSDFRDFQFIFGNSLNFAFHWLLLGWSCPISGLGKEQVDYCWLSAAIAYGLRLSSGFWLISLHLYFPSLLLHTHWSSWRLRKGKRFVLISVNHDSLRDRCDVCFWVLALYIGLGTFLSENFQL